MKFFTIFASRNDTSDIEGFITQVFQNGFKVERNKNEYTIQSKRLFGKNKIIIRVDSEESSPDYFFNNIPGMMHMYDQIEFQEEHLKKMVLAQISVINTIIAIETKKDYSDEYVELFLKLLNGVNGIGFIPDRTLIGKDGKVIVFPDGSSGPSEFTPQVCTNKIRGQNSTSTDGEKRKQKSISYLQDKGIPYIEGLPQLPPLTSIQLRSREEITKRAVALLIVIQYACDVAQEGDLKTSKEFVMELLNQFDVVESLTMQERNFLNSEEPDEKEAIQIAWQYEAQWVLLWSIGLVNTLKFPKEICDCHYAIKLVSDCSSFNEFYQKTKLRNAEEILDEADLIYRLHWACVHDRINAREATAGMHESIVIERRRGLFWLINYKNEDWDYISMDT
ncbi:hypothetical protein IK7_03779 [Bacillus cereus VD156]|uniref:DUF4272 domain-containing protein n=1 Tax=Bacillus cereus group TaxID=86661 RepID=UPI000279A034|nr:MULTISPECIES: DUF4272 domain-containing protein [Bacillus cereus group]EJR79298.1 hypothetical protein IK7_03779 [Bacillus cereus VD156]MBJ8148798.1 DUF4272 domain-containing protein [Bacillus cereus]